MLTSYEQSTSEMLIRGFNAAFVFQQSDRNLFYELVAIQLRAGLPITKVMNNLAATEDLPPSIIKAAIVCREALAEGDTLAKGLFETRSVPIQDVGFIEAAEQHHNLLALLENIGEQQKASAGLGVTVIAPNGYYFFILAMVMVMLYSGTPLVETFARINASAYELPISRAVLFVNGYGRNGLVLLIAMGLGLWILRRSLYGRCRLFLGPLNKDYRRLIAVKFADMASMMLRQGLEHMEILTIARMSFIDGYSQQAVNEAILRLSQAEPFHEALSDTLFDPTDSELLNQMVPQGNPDLYAGAFGAVAKIISTKNKQYHEMLRRTVMTLCLAGIAFLLILIITGIIDSTSVFQ